MIVAAWEALPARFPHVELDEWIVMPNHLHGIVLLTASNVGAPLVGAQRADVSPLGNVIGAFKSITTNEYIRGVRELGWPLFVKRIWQRNYHEHIIRNDRELNSTRDYIFNNPLQWALDHDNPGSIPSPAENNDE